MTTGSMCIVPVQSTGKELSSLVRRYDHSITVFDLHNFSGPGYSRTSMGVDGNKEEQHKNNRNNLK